MTKHGAKRHMKRIAVPAHVPIHNKKDRTFITNPNPGPHTKGSSTALSTALVELIQLPHTAKEARYLLVKRAVKVDGRVRINEKIPVGLWDVIEVEGSGAYRITLDDHGRLSVVEESDDKKNLKPLKVKKKVLVKSGKIQLTFNDGRVLLVDDNNYKVGDVVLFDLKDKAIKAHIKGEPGAVCMIIEGKHAGKVAKLKDVEVKGASAEKTAVLEKDGKEFRTRYEYIFPLPEGFYGN